jgi:hypothetical protein
MLKRHSKNVVGYRDKDGNRKDFDKPVSLWEAVARTGQERG